MTHLDLITLIVIIDVPEYKRRDRIPSELNATTPGSTPWRSDGMIAFLLGRATLYLDEASCSSVSFPYSSRLTHIVVESIREFVAVVMGGGGVAWWEIEEAIGFI
jgi:hypothetical protein